MTIKINQDITSVRLAGQTPSSQPVSGEIEIPDECDGISIKLKDTTEHATYLQVFYVEQDGIKRPVRMFITTKDPNKQVTAQAVGRLASAILRKGGSYKFLASELAQITDSTHGYFMKGKYYPSWIAHVGSALGDVFKRWSGIEETSVASGSVVSGGVPEMTAGPCPSCGSYNTKAEDGCFACLDCGHSKCG